MKRTIVSVFVIGGIIYANGQETNKKKDSDTLTNEKKIEEVIITSSYGTKKLKEEVVGSISTITYKDISFSQPFESLDKMIAGLTPGVQVVNNTELAKPVNINIRGLGSAVSLFGLQGTSTQPLIIIDGIIIREDQPFDALGFDGSTTSETNINPLARLNTDNVETINILKDAAAVALYGADAANGVILITTKRGRKGRPTYTFTSQYGVSQSINKIKYLSGPQYSELLDAYKKSVNPNDSYIWNGIDVNWFEVMNKNGDFFKTNFTASGGGKHINYRLGLDYSKNNEAKVMNSLEKKGFDATTGFDFGKLQASLYTAYNELSKNQPNTYFNFILAPTIPIYDKDGNYSKTGTAGIPNPLAAANQNIADLKNKSLLTSLNISYQFSKNLKLSTVFGLDWSDKKDILWRSGLNESGRQTGTFTIDNIRYDRLGRSRISLSDSKKWNWSAQLYYDKNFSEHHHIDYLLGSEIRSNKDFKTNHSGSNFVNPYTYQYPWQAATYLSDNVLTNGYTLRNLTNENAGRSFFSQINYDYKKKYFFTATLRRDESSAFGDDKDAAYNGAVGGSWVLSKEKFLRNNNFLKFLRLRSSWGMTGNSRIGSYRASGLFNVFINNGFMYDYNYAYPNSSAPQIRQLGWEKNEMINFGIDFNFKQRVDLTIELYRNNKSDMIVSRQTPLETGYSSADINGQAMYNKGIEVSLKAYWLTKKDYRWTTTFNIGTVKNKVTELQGFGERFSIGSLARAQKIGVPTSAIWGYQWIGVNSQNGRDLYLINGEVKDTSQFSSSEDTFSIIGDSQPDAIGGMNNTLMFKNFSLSFLINFEIGGDILLPQEIIDQYKILGNRNMSVNALDYWTTPGQTATNHIPSRINPTIPNSTKYLYDNTFVKLQNINLSYKIPIERDGKSLIKNATIFIDCTNVLYWYKVKSPQDKNGVREFRYLYPEMRTFSFGFRTSF